MNQKPMLSIVTVSYKSKQLLEVLARCIEDLNPDVHYEWLVVQNTPEETQDQDIRRNDSRFVLLKDLSSLRKNQRTGHMVLFIMLKLWP